MTARQVRVQGWAPLLAIIQSHRLRAALMSVTDAFPDSQGGKQVKSADGRLGGAAPKCHIQPSLTLQWPGLSRLTMCN